MRPKHGCVRLGAMAATTAELPDGYRIEERQPSAEEYRCICAEVGWAGAINFDAAPDSLARSLHCCVVIHEDEAVGMGRIVGDGAIYFYIQDVAVVPAHQGRRLGALILRTLVDWVRANAPEKAFVGLFAATGTEPFYRRFGFEAHPELTGMFRTTPIPPLD
jgi:GNAT superfamily N-acetyltransferase